MKHILKICFNYLTLFRVVSKIMNQLDIDPAELRGIGIQINKLESRAVKRNGCIENFISNMKTEPKKNQISLKENSDEYKNISETKNCQSSSNAETTCSENNKPKTVPDFFKPKENNLSSTSKSSSNISHQSLINIDQVDLSFLEALPADIRQEIENELKANKRQNSLSVEHENTSNMEITMTEESSKLYKHVHVGQMKEFIEEWVATENEPLACDNIMVSEYLCNLVKDAKTEDAYEIIRKLYR